MIIDYRYGSVTYPYVYQQKIIDKLNPKKHWWYPRNTISLSKAVTDIFESVEIKLGYYPNLKNFNIVMVEDGDELLNIQISLYGIPKFYNVNGFVSLSRNTVYVCINTLKPQVLRHEFGHLLFHLLISKQKVKSDLHEMVAEYVEH